MRRRMSLFVTVLVAVALVGMIPLGAAVADPIGAVATDGLAGDADETDGEENETGSDLKPGERFSGVVGVQQAELEGDVEDRAFGIRLAEAETDAERAAVLAEQLDRNERRLEAVSDRQNELRDRRAAGEMSEGAYTARTARTGAEVESVKRTTERGAAAADSLPDLVRQERNVGVDRIDALRDRANSLSGPEVAEMAREIGGNRTGAPTGPPREGGPGTGIGPPGDDADAPGSDGPTGNGTEAGNGAAGGNGTEAGNGAAGGNGTEAGDGGATGASNDTHSENAPAGNNTAPDGSAGDGDEHEGPPDETSDDGTTGGDDADGDDTNGDDTNERGADGDGSDERGADGGDADPSESNGTGPGAPTDVSADRR